MALNKPKGNMYDFVTHTWNTVKGACPHDCSYCYMKRWGALKPAHFDRKELKTDLGEGNFIFVGSSCDLFAHDIPAEWISETLRACRHAENQYLFQSKHPSRMDGWFYDGLMPTDSVVCTTIETNRWYPEIMRNADTPSLRAAGLELLPATSYVTIEPILDFDLEPLVELVKRCEPAQVNIGADSGHNNLPEPPAEKVLALIDELKKFTTIARKTNLKRILGGEA
jgi:hypothetical protein